MVRVYWMFACEMGGAVVGDRANGVLGLPPCALCGALGVRLLEAPQVPVCHRADFWAR